MPQQTQIGLGGDQANLSHGWCKYAQTQIVTVLDFVSAEMLPYDETGKRTYAKACERLGVVPSSSILSKLGNSKMIDCKHYGLGPRGTMALAIALVVSMPTTLA